MKMMAILLIADVNWQMLNELSGQKEQTLLVFSSIPNLFFCRVDAMAAPLSEKGVELERTLGYFQFNRDVDDEEVGTIHV